MNAHLNNRIPEYQLTCLRKMNNFNVDIRNIAQPTFNLLKESVGNWNNRDSSTFTNVYRLTTL